jgi:hypothetical protein
LELLRNSGIDVPELEGLDLPKEAQYLWGMYLDLVNTTQITYAEIEAWSNLVQANIKPWEVSAIMRLENKRKRNG